MDAIRLLIEFHHRKLNKHHLRPQLTSGQCSGLEGSFREEKFQFTDKGKRESE